MERFPDPVAVVITFEFNLRSPMCTDDPPLGTRLIESVDLTASILFPFILIAGIDMAPVPDGVKIKSSLDLLAFISLPLTVIPSSVDVPDTDSAVVVVVPDTCSVV